MEQKGGVVAGRQGSSENNHAKNGAPEAACAPKAAAAMPRHRRSKRSVSACCPRLRRLLHFHIWSSKLRCFNFAAVSISCFFSASSDRIAEACKHGPSRGAVEQCRGQAQVATAPFSSKVSLLITTELFTAQEDVDLFLLLTGFLCGKKYSLSEHAGREEALRDSGRVLGSPGAARSKAERVAKPPRVPGERCEYLKKTRRF